MWCHCCITAAVSCDAPTWSPDFATNVAIAMIDQAHWHPGNELQVEAPDGARPLLVRGEFWA